MTSALKQRLYVLRSKPILTFLRLSSRASLALSTSITRFWNAASTASACSFMSRDVSLRTLSIRVRSSTEAILSCSALTMLSCECWAQDSGVDWLTHTHTHTTIRLLTVDKQHTTSDHTDRVYHLHITYYVSATTSVFRTFFTRLALPTFFTINPIISLTTLCDHLLDTTPTENANDAYISWNLAAPG